MTTNVGKVLAVLTMVASLTFFAFVSVATFGGTNWEAVAHNMDGYTFTESPEHVWSGQKHVGEGQLTSSKTIEAVIDAAYQDMNTTAQNELRELEADTPTIQQQVDEAKAAIEVDIAALDARLEEVRQQLADKRADVDAKTSEVQEAAVKVQELEDRIRLRREDVLRLQAQVEEIRIDRFRIQEIDQQLRDLIQQIDGSIERARRRQTQLER